MAANINWIVSGHFSMSTNYTGEIEMNLQKFCLEIGNYGCYLLSIYKAILNTSTDACILARIANDYDYFKEHYIIGDDCEILQPEMICKRYGINVVVEKTKNWPDNALFVIGKWHNKRTGYSHFVLMKGPREVAYDPLGDSLTVKNGDIESYRVFIAKQ